MQKGKHKSKVRFAKASSSIIFVNKVLRFTTALKFFFVELLVLKKYCTKFNPDYNWKVKNMSQENMSCASD